jgi:putative FmdB family regulatory protein
MPIYEYLCKDCGQEFEVLRSMKEADSPMACKKCNGSHTTRMISTFVAKSGERVVTHSGGGGGGGCGGCSGGSCGSCHH